MAKVEFKIPKIEDMLEAGVHFGHQSKRWHPYMQKYIYSTDNKTHIINIYKTQEMLEKACEFLYETAKLGKQIVFVGTKRQAVEIVERNAKDSGALFVTQRWLGGTFTNYNSVKKNWKELVDLKEKRETNGFSHYTKRERLLIDRKIDKLELFVGGIVGMRKFPGAMIVIDTKRDRTAVREANQVEVPVVGLVDTNTDPTNVNYVIPANDDAIKSLDLLINAMGDAIKQGYEEYFNESTPAEAKVEVKAKEVKPEVKEPKVKEAKVPAEVKASKEVKETKTPKKVK